MFTCHLHAHRISSAGITQTTFHLACGDSPSRKGYQMKTRYRPQSHSPRWLVATWCIRKKGPRGLPSFRTVQVSADLRVPPRARRSYTAEPGGNHHNKKPLCEGFASARPCAKLCTSGTVCSVPCLRVTQNRRTLGGATGSFLPQLMPCRRGVLSKTTSVLHPMYWHSSRHYFRQRTKQNKHLPSSKLHVWGVGR